MGPLYRIPLKLIDGTETDLSQYEDTVLLIVNTASRCGFTGQYKGLEELYEKYKHRGFAVLGFPCNQFANQEPEDDNAIRSFCTLNYAVKFPLFSKIEVNGPNTHPLYSELKQRAPGLLGTQAIKWNFTKFLIAKHAATVLRFASATAPADLEKEIEKFL